MDTLTIFCLGTGHEQDERWSITRALFDLTKATEITRDQLTSSTSTPRDGKVIFDGPPLFIASNEVLEDNCRSAVDFINDNGIEKISLVGHSRGAVLCAMIAARSYLDLGRTTKRFNLFLIDIVAHTHLLGGLPVIGREYGLTAYPNVREIVRVVMEDEFNLPAVFPLEDVRLNDGPIAEGEAATWSDHEEGQDVVDEIGFIRLPGGHGNATQVNPVAKNGDTLPIGDIHTQGPGTLWPIGEACMIHALDSLAAWGVPLEDKADEFRGPGRLLDAYSRIRLRHVRRPDKWILLNDVTESRAGAPQTSDFRWGLRSKDALDRYGTDDRFNELIVNDRHRDLIRSETSAALAAAMDGVGAATGTDVDRDLAAGSPGDVEALSNDIRALRRSRPNAYATLVHLGYALGGQPLFSRAP